MTTAKKFLDYDGLVKVLQELQNYPDNTILSAVIDAIQDQLDKKAGPDDLAQYLEKFGVATTSTAGLMSSNDKLLLDSLNPNISVTISDLNQQETHIVGAKRENLLNLEILAQPQIATKIRTSNLLDADNIMGESYIGAGGTISSSSNDRLGDFIPVSPGDIIYYTGTVGTTTSTTINRRLHVYNANKIWIKQLNYASNLKTYDNWSVSGVIPDNGAYVRVSWGNTDYNLMICVGAPERYEPYYIAPFKTITEATFKIADNADYTDAATYSVTVPATAGDLYSFKYNPILGKIYVTTGHIASYNGETLPGAWLSDRDTYIENTSPSLGAEVLYTLNNEDIVEYNITPLTVKMFYKINYLFAENGLINSFTYYAETFKADHFTVGYGVAFGNTNISEDNVLNWERAAELIDTKADINSPAFTGNPTATTPSPTNSSTRLATTEFVQTKMNNIAPVEFSNKANQNYEVGQYLMYNGQLYKVTVAIAKNTTITPGTNVSATNIATELNSLFSLVS